MALIYLNGRFLSQAVTGVQRFAREITTSLDRLWRADDRPGPVMLTPAIQKDIPDYRTIRVKPVGRLRGHIWEQLELPFQARGGILVNLANAAPILSRRQIVVLHDAGVFVHPEAYSAPYRLAHRGLEHLLARSRAKLVTVSKFSRDDIAKHLRVPPAQIGVISEGADHILRSAPDRSILERHGLAPRGFVLAVGSLVAHKNLPALNDLAQSLDRRGLHLAVAGSVAAAVFDTASVQLPQPAKYLGRVSDGALHALYESAACFVFPSRYEGFGIPPVEAMACDCPVVAATAGAVMEICGDAALYCDPDDPAQITAAVTRILDEPDLASALRERGRERVRPLTWDNAAEALLRLIERFRHESGDEDWSKHGGDSNLHN